MKQNVFASLLAALVAAGAMITCGDGGGDPVPDPVGTWAPDGDANELAAAHVEGSAVTIDAGAYLARYSSRGALISVIPIAEHRENVRVFDVALLEDGSAIIAGTEGNTMNRSIFTARYDAEGTVAWHVTHDVKTPRSEGTPTGAVTALADGGFVLTNAFVGTARFGSASRLTPTFELEARGVSDGFIAKMSADGDTVWAHAFGDEGMDDSTAAHGLSDGGMLVAGHESDGAAFGFEEDRTAFVAKWSSAGELEWTQVIQTECGRHVRSIAARHDGSFVIAGSARNAVCMAESSVGTSSGEQAFVAGFDESGDMQWTRNLRYVAPSPWSTSWVLTKASNVALTDDGSAFAVGTGNMCIQIDPIMPCGLDVSAAFVVKLTDANSSDGPDVEWMRAITGGMQSPRTVTPIRGGAWVTGEFEKLGTFAAGTSLTSLGAFDGFIAQYDDDGAITALRTMAVGPGAASSQAARVLADGSIIVAGNTDDEATFAVTRPPMMR